MRVETIVSRVLGTWRRCVHAKRLKAMLVVVAGIVRAGRLSLTSVGRGLPSQALVKHSIKRVDRLLGNAAFHRERWVHFAAMCEFLIGERGRVVVVVDWTKVVGCFHALYAAVATAGRAQTVYLEVHPERRVGTKRIHERFLRSLREVLPRGCRPIIVTDAGFYGPFFREVQRLGWDFVGRVRGITTMRAHGSSTWSNVRGIYRQASAVATDLGLFQLYKKTGRGFDARLVLVHKKRAGRHPWRRRLSSEHASTMTAGKEPWLLATSLAHSAADVVRYYAARMQIEETFRDVKNHRFGWSLRDVRSSSRRRLEVLLLLCAVAMLAVTLIGLAVERCRLHRHYQANTVKKRVLSLFSLGVAFLRAPGRLVLDFRSRLRTLVDEAVSAEGLFRC